MVSTTWLHANAEIGLVLELSAADGQFVLPNPPPERLLMIAGGSGITPLMAILQQLARNRFDGEIVFSAAVPTHGSTPVQ